MKPPIKRREFLKAAGVGAGALALSCVSPGSNEGQTCRNRERRPNIILIMADDIGYECLGSYGSTSYRTPQLDGMARRGVRFEHCYSQPLCTPSRVQIMTGRYNHRNYIGFGKLKEDEVTFGHVLQRAGYSTCVAGKWQLAGPENAPRHFGFDESCLWFLKPNLRGGRYADPLIHQNGVRRDDLKGRYGPDVFCEFIEDYIERNRERPFFVYYPMALPHAPFVPTPDSDDPIDPQDKSHPKYFGDMIAYIDKIVGRIVAKLDETGLSENTLVLFTGDNGTSSQIESKFGDKTIVGGKNKMTDAGTRVPFIAEWKGTAPGGRVNDDLIDFSDFLPTLAEAVGGDLPAGVEIDGRSFLPQIRGERGEPREWIFCHYWKSGRKPESIREFVRDKRWKLYDDGQFFDVAADSLEERPLGNEEIGKEAATARKRLQAVFDNMMR